MKFATALLAFAAIALATEDHDHDKGKDKTRTIVTEVLTTYTTVCPVTVTKPGHGTTQYEVITTTSTIVEKVPTTVYEHLPGHTDYVTKTDVEYTTYTSLCPVTETITGEGHTYTKTYTTISTIVEKVPTKVWETVPGPTVIEKTKEVEYTTITKLIPHTKTLTQDGHTITQTYTETETIVTKVPTKIWETVKLPDVTKTEKDVEYTTITKLVPHTKTLTQDGHTITQTYTETETIVTKVPTKIWETVKLPDVTKTEKGVEYTTLTSLCPITETKTVGGETVVVTWISTSTIVTQVPTKVDVYTTVKTTQHLSTEVYETITKPVTTYQTIEHGETHWVTATGTKTITVEKVHTITEVLVETKTKHVEVTHAVTVGGEDVVTQKSWVYVTVSGTVYATQTRAPVTAVVPTTSAVTIPVTTVASTVVGTSAPVVVETGSADARKAPAAVFLAGVLGAVALL
ncbi:hypothetical protein CDEST_00982 [Colletotrichum destructivum]|uniref:Repetitive proline-rich cell wall protein n=1 Tax=Colletotrichum destructivum TaxID=34406 RepID=A0AAX4HYY8_9PEZI|nr:hypothetical protein CDEST_00982 [Colletotrichum destructivum]